MIAPTGPRVRSLVVDRRDDRRGGACAGARQPAAPLGRRSATCSSGWASRAYWAYDPFVTRNAHRNLTRLGADVVEYVPDMYGDSDSDGNADAATVLPEARVVRVAVPADIEQVQTMSLELAPAWRRCTRRAFQSYLARGYRVVGFFSADERGYYVLAAPDPAAAR